MLPINDTVCPSYWNDGIIESIDDLILIRLPMDMELGYAWLRLPAQSQTAQKIS